MSPEKLQTICQIIIFVGIIITAAGGYGSFHFGKKANKVKEQLSQQQNEQNEKKLEQIQGAMVRALNHDALNQRFDGGWFLFDSNARITESKALSKDQSPWKFQPKKIAFRNSKLVEAIIDVTYPDGVTIHLDLAFGPMQNELRLLTPIERGNPRALIFQVLDQELEDTLRVLIGVIKDPERVEKIRQQPNPPGAIRRL